MFHSSTLAPAQRRFYYFGRAAGHAVKRHAVPIVVMGSLSAVRCFAAASPLAKLFTDVSAEATTTWAVSFAAIGLVVGLIGLKLSDNARAKEYMSGLAIVCFCLLTVQGVITWLQSE